MYISDQGVFGVAMVKYTQSCTQPACGITEISYVEASAAMGRSSVTMRVDLIAFLSRPEPSKSCGGAGDAYGRAHFPQLLRRRLG